jgi:hypothetical protein
MVTQIVEQGDTMKRKLFPITVFALCGLLYLVWCGAIHPPRQKVKLRTISTLGIGTNEFSFVVPDGIRSDHLELLSFLVKAKPANANLSDISGRFRIYDCQTVWQDSLSETNLIGYLQKSNKTPGVFPLYGNPEKRADDATVQRGWPTTFEEGRTFTCLFVIDRMPDATLAFQIEWLTDQVTIWK